MKTFCKYCVPFLESTSNFKHFEGKHDHHRYCISKITDCENDC